MKFKPLEWNTGERDSDGGYLISAASPSYYLTIGYSEGQFYPLWDNAHPGSTSLTEIQALAQSFHENRLKEQFERWIEVDT